MKRGDDLFRLIKSLSPQEKSAYLRRDPTNKNHPGKGLLFQQIDLQSTYEADELLTRLRAAGLKGQFSTVKYRLRSDLLNFLSDSLNQQPVYKLRRQQDHIAILLEKGLFRQALNETRKAKKHAQALDANPVLLELLQVEGRILRQLGGAKLGQHLETIHREQAHTLQLLQEEQTLSRHYDHLFIKIREKKDIHSAESQDWLAQWMNQVRAVPLSPGHFQNKRIRLHILVYYYQAIAKPEVVMPLLEEIVSLWQAWPQRIRSEPEGYLNACRWLLEAATSNEDDATYTRIRQTLTVLQLPTDKLRANLSYITLHTDLIQRIGKFDFSELPDIEQRFQTHQKKFPNYIEVSYTIGLQFNLFNACFLDGNYSKANRWRRQMEVEGYKAERKDIKDFARIAEILIDFARKDASRLENSLRNHRRMFGQQPATHPLELAFIDWVRNLYLENGFYLNPADVHTMSATLTNYEAQHGALPLGWPLVRWWLDEKIAP